MHIYTILGLLKSSEAEFFFNETICSEVTQRQFTSQLCADEWITDLLKSMRFKSTKQIVPTKGANVIGRNIEVRAYNTRELLQRRLKSSNR